MHLLRGSLVAALAFVPLAALAACDADPFAPSVYPSNPPSIGVAAAQTAQTARQEPEDDPDVTAARAQMRAASEAAATAFASGARAKETPSGAAPDPLVALAPLPGSDPTSSAASSEPPPASPPSPSASPPPSALAYLVTCDGNYAGSYRTTEGAANVTQSACRVDVTYARGTMTCAARGASLDCTWQEGDSSGKATFRHGEGGIWTGSSGGETNATARGPWTFTRS